MAAFKFTSRDFDTIRADLGGVTAERQGTLVQIRRLLLTTIRRVRVQPVPKLPKNIAEN